MVFALCKKIISHIFSFVILFVALVCVFSSSASATTDPVISGLANGDTISFLVRLLNISVNQGIHTSQVITGADQWVCPKNDTVIRGEHSFLPQVILRDGHNYEVYVCQYCNMTGDEVLHENNADIQAIIIEALASLPAQVPSTPETSAHSSNKWISNVDARNPISTGSGKIDVSFSYSDLEALVTTLNNGSSNYDYALVSIGADFYGVRRIAPNGGPTTAEWLANSKGYPLLTTKNPQSSVINQDFHYYAPVTNVEDNSDHSVNTEVTDNTKILDMTNGSFHLNVDDSTTIEHLVKNLYYDMSTQTYSADTYNITYDVDNRQYVTNNYTWNITYNISNTYVTYIGGNDAWEQDEYIYYYELPDGRSSADLTADDIAAMSFQFYDCINYNRSATDSSLRALYHFDGNTDDDGFFSNRTSFTWTQGASITYMDSSAFNGALYLDETAHDFEVRLPTSIFENQDFTIQWRYYQASQPDTQDNVENSVSLGGSPFLSWDEREVKRVFGYQCVTPMPIGNWCELAFVRHNGTMYFYVNGIKVYSRAVTQAYNNVLKFTFGNTSRAYSMVDELRVLNFAIAENGTSYTPTSVPHDTNLVLTLPGTEKVTDTYWEFVNTAEPVHAQDFSNGLELVYLGSSVGSFSSVADWRFNSGGLSTAACEVSDTSVTLSNTSASAWNKYVGLYMLLSKQVDTTNGNVNTTYYPGIKEGGQYTLSIVDSDGKIYSVPFTFSYLGGNITQKVLATFEWGEVRYVFDGGATSEKGIFLALAPGKSLDVVYMELVAGSSSALTAERVYCQYQVADLEPNTAAVQTDIPIHGYTVGGVRPTFPVRGDVWFMVTAGRVSNVQVYNGSAWEASNARYWTGVRWIPIYAFDIFTLEDCWDVADKEDVVTQITNEPGFWNWWKGQWLDWRSWFESVFNGGGSSEPSPSPSPEPSPSPSQEPGGNVIPGEKVLELAPYVSIVRENTETWTANSGTSVTLDMETGDLWQGTNTLRNLFVLDVLTYEFEGRNVTVSLDIDGLPVPAYNHWDGAGFYLYQDDDNYISVGKKCHFAGFSVVEEVNASGRETAGSSAYSGVSSATLAFTIGDRSVEVNAKPAGGDWVRVGGYSIENFGTLKLAFGCAEYHERDLKVTFSNLRISPSLATPNLDKLFEVTPTPFFVTTEVGGADEGTLLDAFSGLLSGVWKLFTGSVNTLFGSSVGFFAQVPGGVNDFFGSFEGDSGVFGYFTYEGDDIWD